MSMCICDFCNELKYLDLVEGEFDEEPETNRKTTEQIIQGMEKQVNSPEWKQLKGECNA